MMRDIFIKGNQVTITFYAILNDDLNFSFKRTYASDTEARNGLIDYIAKTKALKTGLPYNSETKKRINQSIERFMGDIIRKEVELPDTQYEYQGDTEYLQTLLKQYTQYLPPFN
ncbi:MAG: hypothetical protein ABJN69_08075 [Hellea sp.]